jgi:tight adherence protein B
VVASDEDLAGAFDGVGTALASRFRVTFPAPEGASGIVPLSLTSGDATAQVAYTTGSVRVGSQALAPVADASGSGGALASPLVKWIALLLGVVAIVMVVWTGLSMVLPSETNLAGRLEVYDESYAADRPEDDYVAGSGQATVPIIQRAVELTGEFADRQGFLDKLELRLERANMPLRAAEAIFFTGASAVVLALLAFVATGNLLMGVVAGALAVILPMAMLNFKVRSRQKAFVSQLPDMLALLAGTLKAGYSIGQGFESISTEISDPMGRELRRVVTETRLGRSLEESLESVAIRMDSDDFGWTVMAIKIQREVGGNLAELLMTVADTMTQRERLRRDVSTLTAEGRMSAIIIGILPPGLAAVLAVMNPEYIAVLFKPGLGYALLAAALVMMGIGFAWMKKCITIEV